MKVSLSIVLIGFLSISSYTPTNVNAVAVSRNGELSSPALSVRDILSSGRLEKRRGGGGRSSSSSSGGSRGSGSSSSSSSTSSRSNTGGTSRGGSGKSPSYGGSRRVYSGGAVVPYTAGRRTPRGIIPFLIPVALLSFFPGLWLFSVFAYPWPNPASFYNTTSKANETIPVLCLCQEFSVCGCEENTETEYIEQIIGEASRNRSVARISNVNGTETLVINGTLPNGTTADGATGAAGMGMRRLAGETLGVWVVAGIVAWGVFFS